jgi:hypothetical protein
MKRSFLLLIFISQLILSAKSQNNFIACGEQSGTWNYDTVFVHCDVVVPHLQMLQILPGTKIIFDGHYSIHVQGNIKALGTATDSIIFTIADTLGFGDIHSNAGGWNGLRFADVSQENDSSLFSFCKFSYGKAVGDSANCFGGAIRALRSNKIAIRNSTLDHNYSFYWGGALYAFKSNVLMDYVKVSNNYAGNDGMIYGYGGGLCFVSSEPDLRFMHFEKNRSTGIGGGASFEYSRPLIVNAVFDDNYSGLGGALGFLRSQPDRQIANLLIMNNEAYFFGGGIANVAASPIMTNVTIVNNYAAMGGGLYCNELSHAKLYNSIIWNNATYDSIGSQVWIWDIVSEPGFYNCAVQYGTSLFGGSTFIGEYLNCTENDPIFADAANGNFRISPQGSCFNAGTPDIPSFSVPEFDLDMMQRIHYGALDMGAFEYNGPVQMNELQADLLEMSVYPVPLQKTSVLEITAETKGKCQLFLDDINGKRHEIRKGIVLSKGKNTFPLSQIFNEIEQLPGGVYLIGVRLENGWQKGIRVVF